MQKFLGSCSPERLCTLQKIFDAIWLEVQTGRRRPTEALRSKIARLVVRHVDDVDPEPGEIARAVLDSLGPDIGLAELPEASRPTFLLTSPRPPRQGVRGP